MIYFDNAATTFPKPESVYEAMDYVNREIAVNAGRGSYKVAREANKIIDELRVELLKIVNGVNGEKAILTTSATNSLQIILHGIEFQPGDTVYVSPYEHNAVARNLEVLRNNKKIIIEEIPLKKDSLELDVEKFKYLISRKPAKCVCCTHVSNVTGYILPVEKIFDIAHKSGAITVLDASQSFGLLKIDTSRYNADFIVFAGHKTLYGPIGAAGFIDVNNIELGSVLAGGTGSDSTNLEMPKESPFKYEAGSKDIVAIAGLNAATKEINQEKNYCHEKEIGNYLIENLNMIDGVTLYLPENIDNHIGVISFNIEGYNSEEVGTILDEDFDIAIRTGFHCAPFIHKHLKNENYLGTVRIGISQFNTKDEAEKLLEAIRDLV